MLTDVSACVQWLRVSAGAGAGAGAGGVRVVDSECRDGEGTLGVCQDTWQEVSGGSE